ncbi:hypothetical protein BST61_g3681 [Cercospora zeina]
MMSAQNDVEMQYQAPGQMSQTAPSAENPTASEIPREQEKPARTFLGMRGGGIILDLCACFICCECVEGCCHAIDDCCCC